MTSGKQPLPPITKLVLEIGDQLPQVPDDWDYRKEILAAIEQKYGESSAKAACESPISSNKDLSI